ncbi:MAG: hypothetical protein IMF26_00100 [Candidatus Fermentithermobacillus carboniphilus]|uniref:Uncharacterized protein n=1 Tax=Candidatus Fermentithermobacillus carboniphilus TaxID=3085328 RepID=A0AAT9LDD5_9FIRM|nr:MAG: hypothetical protein IMF26_00100 [Candidatus Fermentithermobacillus carboniphilus]
MASELRRHEDILDWVELCQVTTEVEMDLIRSALELYGIQLIFKSLLLTSVYPGLSPVTQTGGDPALLHYFSFRRLNVVPPENVYRQVHNDPQEKMSPSAIATLMTP